MSAPSRRVRGSSPLTLARWVRVVRRWDPLIVDLLICCWSGLLRSRGVGRATGQGAAQQPRHLHLRVADVRGDRVLAKVVEEPKTITVRSGSGSSAMSLGSNSLANPSLASPAQAGQPRQA